MKRDYQNFRKRMGITPFHRRVKTIIFYTLTTCDDFKLLYQISNILRSYLRSNYYRVLTHDLYDVYCTYS